MTGLHRQRSISSKACYLCGAPLDGTRPENRDHIPPDQLFAEAIRQPGALQLVTQPVHADCNSSYEFDEKYFVQTLVPFAPGSVAGDAVYKKAIANYKAGKNRPLVTKVLSQFVEQVNGVYMPPRKMAVQQTTLGSIAWCRRSSEAYTFASEARFFPPILT
jgi:hypothetical protein